MKSIALLGEFTPSSEPHIATNAAIAHSRSALGIDLEAEWVATDEISPALFSRFAGVWIAPGSPYRDMQKVLWAIQHAREQRVPCLGTCGGFQHMILEYARNVLGFTDAQHAEYEPLASRLFISKLECSLVGREMKLGFVEGSKVADIYGAASATERYYCNFGVNPDHVELLKSGPLRVTGSDSEGEVRVIELPDHPFFIGTLFVPQSLSTPRAPHALVSAFLRAVASNSIK
jgi:CTP synthase (UTP-ammonia lyase)